MNIIYIANSVVPSRSANSIHVMNMCEALADMGNDITLIIPDRHLEYEDGIEDVFKYYGVKNKFKIVRIKWKYGIRGMSVLFSLIALEKIKKAKPDFVFSRFLPVCCMAVIFRFNTICEMHYILDKPIYRLFYRIMSKRKYFVRLVVITKALEEYYRKITRLDLITVLPDASVLIDRDILAENIKKNRNNIGYVGHLYPGRGIDIIFNIAEELKEYDFHIIGGTNQDIEYWMNKKKGENIFFHGFISPFEVYKYRNACSILLAPYQEIVSVGKGKDNTAAYMSPLKIFDYMASGKAIIASDLPVLKEILIDGYNCRLCGNDNIEEWISAIKELTLDSIQYERLCKNAYSDFLEKYTWEKRAKKVIEGL